LAQVGTVLPGNFKIKKSKSIENDRQVLTLGMDVFLKEQIAIPELDVPLSFLEVIEYPPGSVPQTRIRLHLKSSEAISVTQRKNELKVALPKKMNWKVGEAAILQSVDYMKIYKKSLFAKFEFKGEPLPAKSIFRSLKKDRAVVVLYNTIAENPIPSPKKSKHLKEFKTIQGLTQDSVPYIKFIYTSDYELTTYEREDNQRFFTDFFFGDKIVVPVITKKPPDTVKVQAKVKPVAPEKAAPVSASKTQKVGTSKSDKIWSWVGKGTVLAICGASATYYLLNRKKSTSSGNNDINGIEEEITLPPSP